MTGRAYHRHETRIPLACLLCARTAGEIRDGVLVSGHPESVRRRRCPVCGGRLVDQEAETVLVLLPMPDDDLDAPKRGRPPRITPKPTMPNPRCAHCHTRRAQSGRPRCAPCASLFSRGRPPSDNLERVMAALRDVSPQSAADLGARLGLAIDTVRHLVYRLRAAGEPIAGKPRGYRLEATG